MDRRDREHWFDELTLSLARRASRGEAVKRLALMTAGAVLGPLTQPLRSLAATGVAAKSGSQRPVRITKGIPRPRTAAPLQPIEAGPCTFRLGKSNEIAFSVASSPLRLSVRHDYAVRRASRSAPITLSGTTSVKLDDASSTLLRLNSHYAPSTPHASKPPDATMQLDYGPRMRGISHAELQVRSGTIEGSLDGKTIAPVPVRHGTTAKSLRYADGRPLEVEANAQLNDEMKRLVATAKLSLGSCRPHRSHLQHAAERVSQNGAMLADNPDSNDCCQNGSSMGSGTPHCATASQQVMTDLAVCLASAVGSALFCPPCGIAAVSECYEQLGRDLLALYVPVIGACDEVPCGLTADPNTTQFGIRSCDRDSTCCGDNLCCPSGDVCTPQKICCPPNAPVGCGDERPFCCSANSVCGADGTCLSCGPGQVIRNGACCSNPCGDNDCCVNGEICSQQGTCYYPSFGGATPKPKPPLHSCPLFLNKVSCLAPNADGSRSYVCCSPNVTCCAGKCCDVGETCGGTGSDFRCGFWIK